MEVIAIWLALAVVVAVHARSQGRSVAVWLIAGIVMSPLLAAVLLFGFGPRQAITAVATNKPAAETGFGAISHSAWAGALSVAGVMLSLEGIARFVA